VSSLPLSARNEYFSCVFYAQVLIEVTGGFWGTVSMPLALALALALALGMEGGCGTITQIGY